MATGKEFLPIFQHDVLLRTKGKDRSLSENEPAAFEFIARQVIPKAHQQQRDASPKYFDSLDYDQKVEHVADHSLFLLKDEWAKYDQRLSDVAEGLKACGGTFLIGAGVSYATPANWVLVAGCLAQALKEQPDDLKVELARDPRKPFVRLRAKGAAAQRKFRKLFSRKLEDPNLMPLEPHSGLAMLLDAPQLAMRMMYSVFNWDDFIEQAYHGLTDGKTIAICYGQTEKLAATRMSKPHGCVRNGAIPWVYPDQPPVLNKHFAEWAKTAAPTVVVAVGFRGGPGLTKKRLRALFPNTTVYDIRPQIKANEALGVDILRSAKGALESIWLKLDPKRPLGSEHNRITRELGRLRNLPQP